VKAAAAVLGAVLACGCGGGTAPGGGGTTTTTVAAEGRLGLHDHTPHHGGVVGMVGAIHLEAVATADGRVRVYLTDFWRRPLPLAGVTGTVRLDLPGGDRTLALAAGPDALEARTAPLGAAEVLAHVHLSRDGAPVEMSFVLPVGSGARAAAGVPTGCASPPAGAPAALRCTLAFAHAVTALAAAPDGTTAFVAQVDDGVSAWSLPAATLLAGFAAPPPIAMPAAEPPHADAVNALAVRPDGGAVAVTHENRIVLYAASGALLRALPPLVGAVRAVAWSGDGARLVATAFYDRAAHVLAAEDGRELRRVALGAEGAAVAVGPDGRRAAIGTEAGDVVLFDLDDDTWPRRLTAGTHAVQALAFAGAHLVAGGDDGVLRVWDAGEARLLREIPTGAPVRCLAVAPGGGRVAAAGLARAIGVYDVAEGGAAVATLPWLRAQTLALVWAGDTILAGDADGVVALWSADLSPRRSSGSGSAP